uniref:Perilipin n=1 Tax=Bubo bubo TaxID=30461 RepID=A0A8C0EIW8_BUBBB
MASEKTTKKDLLEAEEQQQESAVNRVTSLPLLNSAFNLVSSAYNYTKETHPYLGGVCNVAETVAAVAVGSVVGGAQPILNQLEPQIALVNEYACKGLDQLEENLPFLQQPADKDRVTNTVTEAVDRTKGAVQDGVGKTKSMVTSTVTTALDAAYGTITSKINTALEQSRGAIQEGVEKTNSVVTSSISKAKAVSQVVAGGVESVLGLSEDLVDHYLPMTEEELGKLATTVEGFGVASVEEQKQQQRYFVRLGSLSNKVRHRAYQHSLNKLQRIKQSTQDTLSRLQLAIKLIESVKKEVGQKLLDGQEKLHQLWVDWSLTQPKGNQVKTVESRTLAMLRIITQQLQPVYENLKASIQGLPSNIQEAVYQATRSIHKLHSSFSSAMSFQDLSSTTLTQSQDRVAEARRSLDDLFEHVTQNTPLNWLVGPFRAIAKVSQDSRNWGREAASQKDFSNTFSFLEKHLARWDFLLSMPVCSGIIFPSHINDFRGLLFVSK